LARLRAWMVAKMAGGKHLLGHPSCLNGRNKLMPSLRFGMICAIAYRLNGMSAVWRSPNRLGHRLLVEFRPPPPSWWLQTRPIIESERWIIEISFGAANTEAPSFQYLRAWGYISCSPTKPKYPYPNYKNESFKYIKIRTSY
jgi:hypothetical protein